MTSSGVRAKFDRIGIAPPGGDDHDLEQTYHETVKNMIRHHRDAVAKASDPYADPARKAQADQHVADMKERLDKVSKADIDAALSGIDEEQQYPQHIAPVGGEVQPAEGSTSGPPEGQEG